MDISPRWHVSDTRASSVPLRPGPLTESSCPYTMSTPYYGPDEDENTINIERFFLAGDFVSGVGYGA